MHFCFLFLALLEIYTVYVSLAPEETPCVLISLEGLSAAKPFNCHSRSEKSLLQTKHVT